MENNLGVSCTLKIEHCLKPGIEFQALSLQMSCSSAFLKYFFLTARPWAERGS